MSEQRLLPLKKRREQPEVVVQREEAAPIIGPLGWPYPILNAILRFLERLRELRYRRYSRPSRIATLDLVRDREGRVIQIVSVEREV